MFSSTFLSHIDKHKFEFLSSHATARIVIFYINNIYIVARKQALLAYVLVHMKKVESLAVFHQTGPQPNAKLAEAM